MLDARGRYINPKSTRATLTIQDQQDQVFTYSRSGNQEEWSVLRGALGKEGQMVAHPQTRAIHGRGVS